MLRAEISIGAIDYGTAVRSVLPSLLRRLKQIPCQDPMILLFRNLGDSAGAVLPQILARLSRTRQTELVCSLAEFFAPEIQEELSSILGTAVGKVQVRNISLRPDNGSGNSSGGLVLTVGSFSCDYAALLRNWNVPKTAGAWKRAAGFLAHRAAHVAERMPPEELERKGLVLLETPYGKRLLLGAIQRAAASRGLTLSLSDIRFQRVSASAAPPPAPQSTDSGLRELHLSDALRKAVQEAAVSCCPDAAGLITGSTAGPSGSP